MPSRTILTVVLILLTAACDRSRSAWEDARAANTVEAYQRFLEQHPESALAADARRALDQLAFDAAARTSTVKAWEAFLKTPREPEIGKRAASAIRDLKGEAALATARMLDTIPAFRRVEREHAGSPAARAASEAVQRLIGERRPEARSINRVAIIVQAQKAIATVPIAKAASEVFALAGVETIADQQAADAVLRIDAGADAQGRSYSGSGLPWDDDSTYIATAASVSGRLELVLRDGATKWSRSFNGRVPPAEALVLYKNEKPPAPPYFEAAGFDHTDDPETRSLLRQDDVVDPAATLAMRLIDLAAELFGASVARAAMTEQLRFRWAALRVTNAVNDPATVDRLLYVLGNAFMDDQFVIAALGRARDARAVPALLPALASPDTRKPSVEALGLIGDARAAAALVDTMEKIADDEAYQDDVRVIIDVLRRLTGRSFGHDVKAWRKWAASVAAEGSR